VSELLAWYRYPVPNGTCYYENELKQLDKVIEVFDYCQILLAYISKEGWDFLITHYGYEGLFVLNDKSGWFDCSTVDELIECIKCQYADTP